MISECMNIASSSSECLILLALSYDINSMGREESSRVGFPLALDIRNIALPSRAEELGRP